MSPYPQNSPKNIGKAIDTRDYITIEHDQAAMPAEAIFQLSLL